MISKHSAYCYSNVKDCVDIVAQRNQVTCNRKFVSQKWKKKINCRVLVSNAYRYKCRKEKWAQAESYMLQKAYNCNDKARLKGILHRISSIRTFIRYVILLRGL